MVGLLVENVNQVATLHDVEMNKRWIIGGIGRIHVNAMFQVTDNAGLAQSGNVGWVEVTRVASIQAAIFRQAAAKRIASCFGYASPCIHSGCRRRCGRWFWRRCRGGSGCWSRSRSRLLGRLWGRRRLLYFGLRRGLLALCSGP